MYKEKTLFINNILILFRKLLIKVFLLYKSYFKIKGLYYINYKLSVNIYIKSIYNCFYYIMCM